MDAFKDIWLQAGAAGLLFAFLAYGNWLQWKRSTVKDEQLLAMAKEVAAVAARSSSSADKLADTLNGNTTAIRELSLLVAGRGASR